MTECSHFGPLRILRLLHPGGDAVCHAVIVHPARRIVAADSLTVDRRVNSGAHALNPSTSSLGMFDDGHRQG